MRILFLDTETTGLDPKVDRVVEIGASLYCAEEKRVLRSAGFFTNDDTIKISPEISAINKIYQATLDTWAVDFKSIFDLLENNFVKKANYLCAHNAPFDKKFIEAELDRMNRPAWTLPWIDTSVDLPYPERMTTRKLTHLACEHEFLNPFPHTALSDTLTCQRIFSMYKLGDILVRAQSPNITVRACVDYANREKASKRGYRWNPGEKKWLKNIKQFDLEKELKDCGFEVEVQSDKTK